jgi:DNA-binding YbaB/EbfC family protein
MNINPFDILKNAQKIQEQMSVVQEKLENISATGAAGGGLVEIDINGKYTVSDVRIAPEAMEDAEMLQDLIIAAFNDAIGKIKEDINQEIGALTDGLNIPGLNGFPGAM